jgi:Concanavalin A-like lectin/glucanases superfamily
VKHRIALILSALFLVLVAAPAVWAACTSPAGNAGDVMYNAGTYHVPQYCDGTNWVKLGQPSATAGGAGCSSPSGTEGNVFYNGDKKYPQYCDGTNWMPMAARPSSGDMVAYWPLDDASGTSASDATGNGNTGTLTNGPTWTAGKMGDGVSFDGVDDSIAVPSFNSDAATMTYTYWVYIPSGITQEQYARTIQTDIVANEPDTGGISHEINQGGVGSDHMGICHWSGSFCSNLGTIVLPYDQWNFVAHVVVGDVGTIYLNGTQVLSASGTRALLNKPMSIGAGGGGFFKGKIDDVRVYNRALSASEIATLAGIGGTCGSIVSGSTLGAYWKFDDGAGTSAADFTGNGHTGTLTNGPVWSSPGYNGSGSAVTYDGVNDYVGAASFADNDTNMTYAFKVYIASADTQAGCAHIFHTNINSTNPTAGTSIELNCGGVGSNHLRICQWNGSGPTNYDGTLLNFDAWNNVVYVATGNSVAVYLNGVQQTLSDDNANGSTRTTGNQPMTIGGGSSTGGVLPFKGKIDDFRIYNGALSNSEAIVLSGGAATSVGNEGDIEYNSDWHTMQYCDGTNWRQLGDRKSSQPSSTGLVGYWKLDETSGISASDSSGSGISGTLSGMSFNATTGGRQGGALSIGGGTQKISASSATLEMAGSYTISAWVKPTTLPTAGNYQGLAVQGGSLTNFGLAITNGVVCPAGLSVFGWFNDSGNTNHNACYLTGLAAGNWYHVAMVWDSSAHNIYLYLNGTLVKTTNTVAAVPAPGDGTFTIGQDACCGGSNLNGTIDEVRVYSRVLSAIEIHDLYVSTSN